jgi:hypothetical protein
MPRSMYASVGIRRDSYRRLLIFAAQLQAKRGKRVTITDAINTLLADKLTEDSLIIPEKDS